MEGHICDNQSSGKQQTCDSGNPLDVLMQKVYDKYTKHI